MRLLELFGLGSLKQPLYCHSTIVLSITVETPPSGKGAFADVKKRVIIPVLVEVEEQDEAGRVELEGNVLVRWQVQLVEVSEEKG